MSRVQIAVLKDGWVLVGDVLLTKESRRTVAVTITQAYSIRIWGTQHGLGEIAFGGPSKGTILDRLGTVFVEPHDLKFLIACDGKKWEKVIKNTPED